MCSRSNLRAALTEALLIGRKEDILGISAKVLADSFICLSTQKEKKKTAKTCEVINEKEDLKKPG